MRLAAVPSPVFLHQAETHINAPFNRGYYYAGLCFAVVLRGGWGERWLATGTLPTCMVYKYIGREMGYGLDIIIIIQRWGRVLAYGL